jgi:RNA polymerase sigma-70 factor (ECF subfamily)
MIGSVIDGEDVVQDALLKAMEAAPEVGSIANPEGWLFRIAHNSALDFLRRRARLAASSADTDPDMIVDHLDVPESRQAAAASLRSFMRLPPAQRSTVILADVLGYSLQEIGTFIDTTLPAVKAALHRGRARLRDLANEPDDVPMPVLAERERALFAAYVDRFNARDFDAIRNMLADEVRLELVARTRMNSRKEVITYFSNYASIEDWLFVPGFVDGDPALLVRDPRHPEAPPSYFVLLTWTGDRVTAIRDFRHARYAVEGATLISA